MDIAWRALMEEDIPAWARFGRAVEEVDREDEHYSEADLAEIYAEPLFDPPRGSLAGFDGDEMVAFGMLRVRSEADEIHRMGFDGAVHPAYRGRGLGTELLRWAPEAARALHEEHYPDSRLGLSTGCISTNQAAATLLERFGFKPVRYYHGMRIALAGEPLHVDPIEGIEIVPYAAELDEQVRLVKNASFKDHWGTAKTLPEQWRTAYLDSVSFRPDLSFIAMRSEAAGNGGACAETDGFGRVVGLAMTKYFEATTTATGEREAHIALLGTLREVRRRGIAHALLASVLHAARAADFDAASLGVDSQNPTGALGIYERIGFTVKDTWVNYQREY